MATREYVKGLEGVIAAESSICRIDGQVGELYYRGYPITELAQKAQFEEVIYLLLYGNLPTHKEYESFHHKACSLRNIGPEIVNIIRQFPKNIHPMEFLQSCIAYLHAYKDSNAELSELHLIMQLATVVAAHHRLLQGLDYIPPRSDLGFGANFLYMLNGNEPEKIESTTMDICLTLHAEHHFNASTFTARVVASTNANSYSAVSAAIGALYGNLHGGANERVMNMVNDIAKVSNVEDWVKRKLDNREKIMGMGHRVYKVKDPRAVIMEDLLKDISEKHNNTTSYTILKSLENITGEYMKQKGKEVYPNVDFFSGAVYDILGIPHKLFTPIFAVARIAGWVAHILEQQENNRLYRPTAIYTGPNIKKVIPLLER